MTDYYEILGISPKATPEEIEEAWRKFTVSFHPDRWDAEKKAYARMRFKMGGEAYETLRDSFKRQQYDRKIFTESSENDPSAERQNKSSSSKKSRHDPYEDFRKKWEEAARESQKRESEQDEPENEPPEDPEPEKEPPETPEPEKEEQESQQSAPYIREDNYSFGKFVRNATLASLALIVISGLYRCGTKTNESNQNTEYHNQGYSPQSYSQPLQKQGKIQTHKAKPAKKEKSLEERIAEARKEEVISFEIEHRRYVGDASQKHTITKEDYPDLFERLDFNGDSIVTKTELGKVIKEINWELISRVAFMVPYEKVLNNFVPEDRLYPNSREITFVYEDLSIALGSNHKERRFYKKSDWPVFWGRLDLNGDGKTTFGELRKALPYLHEYYKENGLSPGNTEKLYTDFIPPKSICTSNNNPITSFSINTAAGEMIVQREEYPDLFYRLDLNGDDLVSEGELSKLKHYITNEIKVVERFYPSMSYKNALQNMVFPKESYKFYSGSKELKEIPEVVSVLKMDGKVIYTEHKFRKKEDYPEFFGRVDLDGNGKVTINEWNKLSSYINEFVKKNHLGSEDMDYLYTDFIPPKDLYTKKN